MISSLYNTKKPVLSFEIYPPKRDIAIESIDDTLGLLAELNPDYISVTFGAGGTLNDNRTFDLAKKIKTQYGIEPLVHLTCLHYSRQEIDDVLESLDSVGINNILVLRGDRNPDIQPKNDFIHAVDLIDYISTKSRYGISAACYPEVHPESHSRIEDMRNLRKKVDAGASHLVTQLFFDNEVFYSFVEDARIAGMDIPITAGVMPVINRKQVERITTLCGANIPPKFLRIMDNFSDNREAMFEAGMAHAVSQIVDLIASETDGIHIYTMNNSKVAKRICESISHILG